MTAAVSRSKWTAFPNYAMLCQAAADRITMAALDSIRRRGRCIMALAGGSTPKGIYEQLGQPSRGGRIDWNKVHLFLGDERYVPPNSPRLNYNMVKTHLLDHIAIPRANVHPVAVRAGSVEKAAAQYEQEIRRVFAGEAGFPAFDMILLGIGEDGHTASLFPGTEALHERKRLVVSVRYDGVPEPRVSLTLPVINNARRVLFAAQREGKKSVIAQVRAGAVGPKALLPAQMVRPRRGTLEWMVV